MPIEDIRITLYVENQGTFGFYAQDDVISSLTPEFVGTRTVGLNSVIKLNKPVAMLYLGEAFATTVSLTGYSEWDATRVTFFADVTARGFSAVQKFEFQVDVPRRKYIRHEMLFDDLNDLVQDDS